MQSSGARMPALAANRKAHAGSRDGAGICAEITSHKLTGQDRSTNPSTLARQRARRPKNGESKWAFEIWRWSPRNSLSTVQALTLHSTNPG